VHFIIIIVIIITIIITIIIAIIITSTRSTSSDLIAMGKVSRYS